MKKLAIFLSIFLGITCYATNPYVGSNITGVNSPGVGVDKNTYTTTFDTSMQKIDEHDHTSGKGLQIPTAGIADSAVTTAKINNLAVTAGKIASGTITTTQIASGTITGSNIASTTVAGSNLVSGTVGTTQLTDLGVTAAKIASSTITATQLADGAVGAGKLGSKVVGYTNLSDLNYNISSSSGTYSTTSSTFSDVTNLSTSLTTIGGRSATIEVVSDGGIAGFNLTDLTCTGNDTNLYGEIRLIRGTSTVVGGQFFGAITKCSTGLTEALMDYPLGITFFDSGVEGTPGTYAYKLQGRFAGTNGSFKVINAKLFVKEN